MSFLLSLSSREAEMMLTQPCETIFFSTPTFGEDKNTHSNNNPAGVKPEREGLPAGWFPGAGSLQTLF